MGWRVSVPFLRVPLGHEEWVTSASKPCRASNESYSNLQGTSLGSNVLADGSDDASDLSLVWIASLPRIGEVSWPVGGLIRRTMVG